MHALRWTLDHPLGVVTAFERRLWAVLFFQKNRAWWKRVHVLLCTRLQSDQASQDMNVQVCGLVGVMLRKHGSLSSREAPVCSWCCGPSTRWAKEWLVPITVLLYLHAITPYTSLLQHRSTCSCPLDTLMFLSLKHCAKTQVFHFLKDKTVQITSS